MINCSAWTGDLDLLINNAGIMAVPAGVTVDGFEQLRRPRHGLVGPPARVGRSKGATDLDLARRLWEASAQLTGIDFPASLST
jgi:hypothetical protein